MSASNFHGKILSNGDILNPRGTEPTLNRGVDEQEINNVATGQRHHLFSNKINRALDNHPTLKGSFNREDPDYIYNAMDEGAHRGYQTWHRQYDNVVVDWLRRNPEATPSQFTQYLNDLHQEPWPQQRIPFVNLLQW